MRGLLEKYRRGDDQAGEQLRERLRFLVTDALATVIRSQTDWRSVWGIFYIDFCIALDRLQRNATPASNVVRYVCNELQHSISRYLRETSADLLPPKSTSWRHGQRDFPLGIVKPATGVEILEAMDYLQDGTIIEGKVRQTYADEDWQIDEESLPGLESEVAGRIEAGQSQAAIMRDLRLTRRQLKTTLRKIGRKFGIAAHDEG